MLPPVWCCKSLANVQVLSVVERLTIAAGWGWPLLQPALKTPVFGISGLTGHR